STPSFAVSDAALRVNSTRLSATTCAPLTTPMSSDDTGLDSTRLLLDAGRRTRCTREPVLRPVVDRARLLFCLAMSTAPFRDDFGASRFRHRAATDAKPKCINRRAPPMLRFAARRQQASGVTVPERDTRWRRT